MMKKKMEPDKVSKNKPERKTRTGTDRVARALKKKANSKLAQRMARTKIAPKVIW